MRILNLSVLIASICFLVPPAIQADTASIRGEVTRLLTSESDFGGCMVLLEDNVQDALPACRANWVTLSCDGSFLASNVSKRLLESVQIAYALEQPVRIYVDDSRRINGYCLAFRVDLVQ